MENFKSIIIIIYVFFFFFFFFFFLLKKEINFIMSKVILINKFNIQYILFKYYSNIKIIINIIILLLCLFYF